MEKRTSLTNEEFIIVSKGIGSAFYSSRKGNTFFGSIVTTPQKAIKAAVDFFKSKKAYLAAKNPIFEEIDEIVLLSHSGKISVSVTANDTFETVLQNYLKQDNELHEKIEKQKLAYLNSPEGIAKTKQLKEKAKLDNKIFAEVLDSLSKVETFDINGDSRSQLQICQKVLTQLVRCHDIDFGETRTKTLCGVLENLGFSNINIEYKDLMIFVERPKELKNNIKVPVVLITSLMHENEMKNYAMFNIVKDLHFNEENSLAQTWLKAQEKTLSEDDKSLNL